jgi:hypothetical protein
MTGEIAIGPGHTADGHYPLSAQRSVGATSHDGWSISAHLESSPMLIQPRWRSEPIVVDS